MLKKHQSVEEYIADFPKDIQKILREIRATIRKAAPKAQEYIHYGMPSVKQNRSLVCFAACKNHIGFYPTSSGVREFASQLTKYKTSKGAIQFPIEKPVPLALITKIVKFRAKEELEKAARKKIQKGLQNK